MERKRKKVKGAEGMRATWRGGRGDEEDIQ